MFDVLNKLNVNTACSVNLHHRYIGKEGSVVANIAMKLFLNVPMCLYFKFLLWQYGGTNLYVMPLSVRYSRKFFGVSLSNQCTLGCSPLSSNFLTNSWIALSCSY